MCSGTTTGTATTQTSSNETSGERTDSDASPDDGSAPLPSCAGACGIRADAGCSCDPLCDVFADCCPDHADMCTGSDPWSDLAGEPLLEALHRYTSATHEPLDEAGAVAAILGQIEPPLDAIDGRLDCVYSGARLAPDGSDNPGGIFTIEHVWPQDLGASAPPRDGDLHHMFPITSDADSARDLRWFGESPCEDDCVWSSGGSKLGRDPEGSLVFDVRTPMRGDVARAVFYFCARYGFSLSDRLEAVLRQWHRRDPPDARESARNDAVQALQGNRNPFIDYAAIEARVADF